MIIFQHGEIVLNAFVPKLAPNHIVALNILRALRSVWICQASYLLVGCYTYPVTKDGKSLVPIPGHSDQEDWMKILTRMLTNILMRMMRRFCLKKKS